MLGSLALAAVLFWALLLASSATSRWSGLAALLLTGKLACLLGALLIFAPRDLYSLPGVSFALCSTGPSTLADRSEEHTSELQSLMRISYAVFCLKKKK